MSESFNGWANRATWLVHQSLTYDQGRYSHWKERAEAMDRHDLADALKDAHTEEAVEVPDGWRKEIVLAAVSEVDWREIASIFRESAAD
nr:hypothetical protein [Thioalkalivibrio sp.]